MYNPLIAKLRHFAEIPSADEAELQRLCADVRPFRAKQDLIKQGDRPEAVFLIMEGWACRYKLLPDGQRQIVGYLIPGDLCDIHIFILRQMDHAIGLLTDAKVCTIPKQRMLDLFDDHPRLTRAMWWSTLTDEAVMREWLVNNGRRDAYKRIAHLLAELWLRLRAVGLAVDGCCELPLTQEQIGDTTGLTSVHVNRILQQLRADGMIEIVRGRLHIPDVPRLMAVTQFEPNYLHLQPERANEPERARQLG